MKVTSVVLHPAAEALLNSFLTSPVHAALLTGPRGSGKTHVATALGAELLGVEGVSNYAYSRTVLPQKGSISIEQVRELVSFFRLKVPGTTRLKRVAIIQDADAMGTEAQNALLKILEEPPEDSVLILTSSQPQRLLPTIRSRVQVLQLPAPEEDALTHYFTALGYKAPAIHSALLRSGTNVAEITSLLAEDSDSTNSTLELVKKTLASNSYDRLLLVDNIAKQKDAAIEFASTLAAVAAASLESAARKGNTSVARWKSALQTAHIAEDALEHSGNTKLVLTELMLAL